VVTNAKATVSKKIDLQAVVSQHYAAVYRFGCALAKNESDAADLTQQTFLILTKRHGRIREPEKAKCWLFTTLRREFLRSSRSRASQREVPFCAKEHDMPTTSKSALRPIDAKLALEALAKVDESYRSALELFYLGDLSYKEISTVLKVPLGTVMSRLSRGKEQLRRALRDDFDATRLVTASSSEVAESEPRSFAPTLLAVQRRALSLVGVCFRQWRDRHCPCKSSSPLRPLSRLSHPPCTLPLSVLCKNVFTSHRLPWFGLRFPLSQTRWLHRSASE
jgi:RNA polymerase sigma-70 factor, ECF subfamily